MKKHIKKNRKKYIAISILLTAFLTLFIYLSTKESSGEKSSFFSLNVINPQKKIEIEINSGDTFGGLLNKAGVPHNQSVAILSSLKDVFDIRTILPKSKNKDGDKIIIYYTQKEEEPMKVEKMEIIRSPLEKIETCYNTDKYESNKNIITPITKLAKAEGKISHGESFIGAAVEKGVPYNIIASFYDIFAFDLDFQRDLRDGDMFSIMYEEKYTPSGEYIGEGALLYGHYKSYFKDIEIYRYTDTSGKVGYYDSKGNGAQKALKKTPINGARLSSGYGLRRHPVLGYSRKHQGVDFAAPSGTPIPAAGDGVIEFRGRKGGYGNYIKIRHNGSYSTAYAHMKSFKSDVRTGTRVRQGQIVGYVGSTGISTGPHLHYEIWKNGVAVNPMTLKMPSITNLKGSELERFKLNKTEFDNQYSLLNIKYKKFVSNLKEEKKDNK